MLLFQPPTRDLLLPHLSRSTSHSLVETQLSKDFPFMNIVVEPHASQIQKFHSVIRPFFWVAMAGIAAGNSTAFPSPFSSFRRTSRRPRWSHQTSSAIWFARISVFLPQTFGVEFLLSFHTFLPTCSRIPEEHAEMQHQDFSASKHWSHGLHQREDIPSCWF